MKRLTQVLSKILDLDESRITDKTSPDNVETWDSFTGLMLVTALEEEFKVEFTMTEVRQIKNVGDIKSLLIKHKVKLHNE